VHTRVGFALSLALILGLVAGAGCGASQKMASSAMAAAQAPAMPNAPPPLDRSLFDRDPKGALTEESLQKILAAPIELDLPARVGLIPIMTATDWRGPGPDNRVPSGVEPLLNELRQSKHFSLLTQTMVIPSGALGMEALREIAARYRLRYVLLYREVLANDSMMTAVAWGYATIVGAFFLPGKRQEVWGYTEVSMFDVKTGTLMFTTRRAIAASQRTNQWHQKEKLEKLASSAIAKFAPDLAHDVLEDLEDFAKAAIAENTRRGVRGPELVTTPPLGTGPTVAQ
jgi:rhombotail lipoprotein